MGRVEVWTSGDIIAIYGSTMSYGSLQFAAFFSPLIIVPKCYVMLIFLEPIGNGSTPLNILLGNCLAYIKSVLHLSVFCLLSSQFSMENLLKTLVQFINNLIIAKSHRMQSTYALLLSSFNFCWLLHWFAFEYVFKYTQRKTATPTINKHDPLKWVCPHEHQF